MAGASIVPSIGAFGRYILQPFINFDFPIGLQFLQQGTQGGAHNACTNQYYICTAVLRILSVEHTCDCLAIVGLAQRPSQIFYSSINMPKALLNGLQHGLISSIQAAPLAA